MAYTIREAVKADSAAILGLIRELALYEKEPEAVVATEELIERHVLSQGSVAKAVVAEDDATNEVVGVAIWHFNFSTWTGRPGLYLEDLYVQERHRKAGLGKRLFAHLGRIAREQDLPRVEFVVLQWNKPSIDFYLSIGTTPLDEWTKIRIDGDAVRRLEHLALAS